MQVETAKLEETIEKILREKPEVIINALKKNPEILKQVVADSLPHNIATKDDIKMLFEFMSARFEDMNKRFEDMKNYTDKRFEFIQRLILFLLGLNLVNTSSLIIILLKIFNAI